MSLRKNVIAGLMLSTIVLSTAAPMIKASATDATDQKIAQNDQTIKDAQSGAYTAKEQADALQSKVDTANTQLTALTKEQTQASAQMKTLLSNIKDRQKDLQSQARSAQTSGGMSNYINTILNSKSLPDMIQKVSAMSQVVSANKEMLKAQQDDETALQKKLNDNAKAYAQATALQQQLALQNAQLKAAQLNYQATIATASDEKAKLLSEKAAADAAAAKVAAQQKAAAAAAAAPAPVSNNTSNNAGGNSTPAATPTPTPTPNPSPVPTPTPTPVPTPPHSRSNPYPAGQCTAFVWQYFGGNMPTYSGNAGDWVAYANSGPAAGTIAVFPPGNQGAGGYGHVAVVLSVSGSQMTIIEGNFNGGWGTTRTVSTAGVSFIRP